MVKKLRAWTTEEERFIANRAGIMTVRDMARVLGRTEESIRVRATRMRKEGRLEKSLRTVGESDFVSYLEECCECHQLRSSVDKSGICPVCKKREQLESNMRTMHRAWANLPPEYKRRTKRRFDPERSPNLMTKSKDLKMPTKPETSGMDDFDAAKAINDWLLDVERYELAILRLDIDAVKQRTCKWRRKTRKYKSEKLKRK